MPRFRQERSFFEDVDGLSVRVKDVMLESGYVSAPVHDKSSYDIAPTFEPRCRGKLESAIREELKKYESDFSKPEQYASVDHALNEHLEGLINSSEPLAAALNLAADNRRKRDEMSLLGPVIGLLAAIGSAPTIYFKLPLDAPAQLLLAGGVGYAALSAYHGLVRHMNNMDADAAIDAVKPSVKEYLEELETLAQP